MVSLMVWDGKNGDTLLWMHTIPLHLTAVLLLVISKNALDKVESTQYSIELASARRMSSRWGVVFMYWYPA